MFFFCARHVRVENSEGDLVDENKLEPEITSQSCGVFSKILQKALQFSVRLFEESFVAFIFVLLLST